MSKNNASSDPSVEALKLDNQLCFALYGAANRMTRLYRPLLDAMGLTYPQYLVMLVLWESSPRTVGALGEALDLDSSTLTPLLKRLEAAGLVERHRDPEDERRVIVDLSDAGRTLREDAKAIPEQMICALDLQMDAISTLRERLKVLAR
ncbi:MarR family transcriptional regulator [Caulobacter sp.]|jgi:DNA-binding MarR family transcriptional regulator|uniref:transcriptional regulator, SarA/Rot family n=1 Tax=Caulobacter sp. TaxID=78 RepID=UPI0016111829